MTIILPIELSAAESKGVNIFGVDVYFLNPPPCSNINESVVVRAKVGYFQEVFSIQELAFELAREALKLFAETAPGSAESNPVALHSMRIISATPGREALIEGQALRCVQTEALHNNPRQDLEKTVAATVFTFSAEAVLESRRTVASSTKSQLAPIKDADLQELKREILAGYLEASPDLSRSCPFLPTVGIEFTNSSEAVWWLISFSCRTGLLVRADDDWRRQKVINLNDQHLKFIGTLLTRYGG